MNNFKYIYHFLPHPEHRRRAKLLQHKALLVYCAVFLLILLSLPVIAKTFPGVLGYASNIDVDTLLTETNLYRKQRGLNALTLNQKLSVAAHSKAKHMFKNNYWAHTAPDGTDPWFFINESGYDYIYAGENLAKNFYHSKDVVLAWYDSPSHRENLLNENYDEVGFAIVNGVLNGYETTLVVQMFGRPRNPLLVQEVYTPVSDKEVSFVESVNVAPLEPKFNVPSVTSSLSIVFITFVLSMLVLDIWYTKKQGIVKLGGHTIAHIAFLLSILFVLMLSIIPGAVL